MKSLCVVFFVLMCLCASAAAQTTEFAYQGSLKNAGSPANGNYDFEFKLFDLVSAGTQQGTTLQRLNIAVANGVFSVSLDFGAATLPGADRFLDIGVRTAGGGAFTPLSPRQKINSAPYSVRSLNSTTADTAANATQLGGVAANQFVVTTDPRMTDARSPTAGSGNYIQNQDAAPQSSSNFNISGTGTANFVNATTQFNLNNSRILSAPASNLFLGLQAGQSNTTGNSNSFFGTSAGANNTIGGNNSFFGYLAGNTTNTGNGNAFFGYSAGRSNTTGGVNSFFGFGAGEFSTTANYNSFFGFNAGNHTTAEGNSFFGASAGEANTIGTNNSFFGIRAGQSNTTGSSNSFFGRDAGLSNTTGNGNSFIGVNTGLSNTEGFGNSFVGSSAGLVNTTGTYNTFLGDSAGFSNTTAGSHVFVGGNAGRSNTTGGSNTFVGKDAGFANTIGGENAFFGAATGQSNTSGNNNSFVGTTAGLLNTTGGDNSFMGHAAGYSNTTGISNSFFGAAAGNSNATGNSNSFFGRNAGIVTTGNENSFFGVFAGGFNSTGIRNTAIGFNANVGAGNLQYATAVGADSTVSASNTIALGRSNGSDQVVIPGTLVANLPAGDGDYIQNRTTLQASSNFNIDGNGFVGGNFGIGTTSPQSKLTIQTPTNNYGLLHTGAGITFGSFVGGTSAPPGGWFGTLTDNPLHFFTNNGTARMSVLSSGNIGIGTTAPTTRLGISGGPPWTSAGWTASLSLGNASALGWEANASGQRFGVGQTNGGLYFFRTNSAFGNTAAPANYDMAITDTGNVSQAGDKSGLVKAMVLVDPFLPASQYVVRCYNFQNDSSTAPCGIAVTRDFTGSYRLDMGFNTSDRFASATIARTFVTQSSISVNPTGTSVFVYVCQSQDSGACIARDERFFLILY